MKSWKTTLGGILLGIGVPLASAGTGFYHTIGIILSSVGGIIMGGFARDNNVSSQDVGIR